MKTKYSVIIHAEDGRHVKRFSTMPAARAYAELQMGSTLESRFERGHEFERNDGGANFRPLDMDALNARHDSVMDCDAEFSLRFVDDYGRAIIIEKHVNF